MGPMQLLSWVRFLLRAQKIIFLNASPLFTLYPSRHQSIYYSFNSYLFSVLSAFTVAKTSFLRYESKIVILSLPCIRLAREKFELTNQNSACGKKLVSSRQCRLTGKTLKSGIFSQRRWREILTKGDLQMPKTFYIAKSEKYETSCVSKVLIWCEIVVRRAWPCKIIVALF